MKFSIDCLHISHPNDIKENRITGVEYFLSNILNNNEEYAELNSAKEALKEGRNLLFSSHVMSVKFNPITSSLKLCLVKRFVIQQTRRNENPYSVWVCINYYGSILTDERGCVAGLTSSCKYAFTISHYIENEVTVGHRKTCTRNKQK